MQNLRKHNCPNCGNNPVPHFIFWYFESVNILLTGLRQRLLRLFSFARFDFSPFFMSLGKGLKIISFNENINQCKVERAKVLWEEALRKGIVMKELLLFGKPFDTYIAGYPLPTTHYPLIFSGLPRPKNIDQAALDVMDDKAILKKKFIKAGLPVPNGKSVWNYWEAKKIFEEINSKKIGDIKSVIVKPRAGSRGRHTTTNVFTLDDLKKAYKIAKQLCFWVVVEEMIKGPVYRATVINYELCGVLRGDPPQVLGDGLSTILQLIKNKNSIKQEGVKDIQINNSLELFLLRQGLSLNSVPKESQIINLSEKIGVNYGGSSSEDFEICHMDNIEMFEKAAKVVNDPIVGFDFIIPDISRSWKKQQCGFIEANSLPFINLHHTPLNGRPRNVAAKVWDMVMAQEK